METSGTAPQKIASQSSQSYSRPLYDFLAKLPWWAIILIFIAVLVIFLIFSNAEYYETFRFLLAGLATTIRITLIAFPIAIVIGLFTGLARLSKNPVLYTGATIYVEVMRGIPLVVLLLIVAFAVVPSIVEIINNTGLWGVYLFESGFFYNLSGRLANFSIRSIPMEGRAIIALAIGYGAFSAEIFRAGIQSISKGQMEAARSLGMSYIQCMRYVILPQAIRRVLPPLGNDFIAMLKDSSLATVLAVMELTQLTRIRKASTFRVMETFMVAAFLYLSLTLALSAGVRLLERRMKFEE